MLQGGGEGEQEKFTTLALHELLGRRDTIAPRLPRPAYLCADGKPKTTSYHVLSRWSSWPRAGPHMFPVPDVTQIPGWPEQRFIHVRVPKGAPRPPGLPPRPRQPSTILEGVFEAAQQADSAVAAQNAAHAVELSPSKVKEKDELRRKRPLPPLNPELYKAVGASAAVLAVTEKREESD